MQSKEVVRNIFLLQLSRLYRYWLFILVIGIISRCIECWAVYLDAKVGYVDSAFSELVQHNILERMTLVSFACYLVKAGTFTYPEPRVRASFLADRSVDMLVW